jgi:hypothetical protein
MCFRLKQRYAEVDQITVITKVFVKDSVSGGHFFVDSLKPLGKNGLNIMSQRCQQMVSDSVFLIPVDPTSCFKVFNPDAEYNKDQAAMLRAPFMVGQALYFYKYSADM